MSETDSTTKTSVTSQSASKLVRPEDVAREVERLRAYARRRFESREDIDDVVQHALAAVLSDIPYLRRNQLWRRLKDIVKSKALASRRQRKHPVEYNTDKLIVAEAEENDSEMIDRRDAASYWSKEARGLVASLPPAQTQAFELIAVDGLRLEAAAKRLDRSIAQVSRDYRAAVARILADFQRRGVEKSDFLVLPPLAGLWKRIRPRVGLSAGIGALLVLAVGVVSCHALMFGWSGASTDETGGAVVADTLGDGESSNIANAGRLEAVLTRSPGGIGSDNLYSNSVVENSHTTESSQGIHAHRFVMADSTEHIVPLRPGERVEQRSTPWPDDEDIVKTTTNYLVSPGDNEGIIAPQKHGLVKHFSKSGQVVSETLYSYNLVIEARMYKKGRLDQRFAYRYSWTTDSVTGELTYSPLVYVYLYFYSTNGKQIERGPYGPQPPTIKSDFTRSQAEFLYRSIEDVPAAFRRFQRVPNPTRERLLSFTQATDPHNHYALTWLSPTIKRWVVREKRNPAYPLLERRAVIVPSTFVRGPALQFSPEGFVHNLTEYTSAIGESWIYLYRWDADNDLAIPEWAVHKSGDSKTMYLIVGTK